MPDSVSFQAVVWWCLACFVMGAMSAVLPMIWCYRLVRQGIEKHIERRAHQILIHLSPQSVREFVNTNELENDEYSILRYNMFVMERLFPELKRRDG